MLSVKEVIKPNKDSDIKLKQEYIKALEDRQFKEFVKLLKIDDTTKEELTVYWYWDGNRSDEVDNEFIGKTLDVEFSLSATQVKYAYMKNGSTSKEAFWSDEYKSKIRRNCRSA